MRILIVAIAFLVVLVAFGLYSNSGLTSQAEELSNYFVDMELMVSDGEWQQAQKTLITMEQQWQKVQFHWDMIIEHHEMDNIDGSLAKLKKYLKTKDETLALGEISTVKHYLKHIPEKEAFNFQNIW
ncbi:DUF4363 family protein [Metallumcola ferriviriculae]|uniref:DUF4363 family protein n=1 Tax=Metallumcola ferriviriculae TaxID=3039180 RepID=A0AAU0UMJ8_9FIRM|nr:DUF4363 family protein [Desulfitibacteraceae bacterium MK1]